LEPEVEIPLATDDFEGSLAEPPVIEQVEVAFKDATVTWPRADQQEPITSNGVATNGNGSSSRASSLAAPKSFELQDIDVEFPKGELSLICGRLGSGKTLMLLGKSTFSTVVRRDLLTLDLSLLHSSSRRSRRGIR